MGLQIVNQMQSRDDQTALGIVVVSVSQNLDGLHNSSGWVYVGVLITDIKPVG